MRRWEKARDQVHGLLMPIELSADGDFTSEELFVGIREGAATVERFLRRLQMNLPRSKNFEAHISHLSSYGLTSTYVDSLHQIRRKANAAKHDPTSVITREDAFRVLSAVETALEAIGVLGSPPQGVQDEVVTSVERRYAILPAYYFHGPRFNEADYEVVLFVEGGLMLNVDQYQIDMENEEKALSILRGLGELDQMPKGGEFDAYRKEFGSASEFWGIWTYTGQLRHMASAFAGFQQSDAMVYLQRGANAAAVRSALGMTLVDLGIAAMPADVCLHLRSSYAIQLAEDSPWVVAVSKLLGEAQRQGRGALHGPRLVAGAAFQALVGGCIVEKDLPGFGIQADRTVLVDLGAPWTPMP